MSIKHTHEFHPNARPQLAQSLSWERHCIRLHATVLVRSVRQSAWPPITNIAQDKRHSRKLEERIVMSLYAHQL